MNPSTYIPIIILWIIIFYVIFRNRRAVVARQIIKKRKLEGNAEMKELAKRFIDKECLISSFDSNHQFEGVIKEVSDSAILVERTELSKQSTLTLLSVSENIRKIKKARKSLLF